MPLVKRYTDGTFGILGVGPRFTEDGVKRLMRLSYNGLYVFSQIYKHNTGLIKDKDLGIIIAPLLKLYGGKTDDETRTN